MDLQSRKLKLISYIAHLENESILNEMESVYKIETGDESQYSLKPFTQVELEARIKLSIEDFKNGDFYTQEEMEKMSAS